ncbi:hypothetical protein AaE_014248 [Aphanomyces astaci]|uniref:Carrier domain-containing protein n=1 Tax=Aphanomyces astaci TaxID=112090 RepID=A0A6A4Z4J1_APHAT|nr:hypothetical protein AaE_014248 [Aphanomyces astaci]
MRSQDHSFDGRATHRIGTVTSDSEELTRHTLPMNSNPEHTASTLPKLDAFLLSDLRDAKVLVQFGGQGSGYLGELAQLVKSFETVRDLVSRAQAALEHTALANEASCILHSLLLADHELIARLSKSALSRACVSYPLVFLTQLASYVAFLETGGLTHQRFLPMIQGGTGHSQGLVAAVLLAAATTQDELVELGLQFVQLMHYHGVLAQEAFDAVNDGVPKVVGTVATPMLLVRGWSEALLSGIVAEFNLDTAPHNPPVQISLVNDATSIVVTGVPTALHRLYATLDGKQSVAVAPFLLEFLPVSCPFHNDMLRAGQSSIESHATALGLCVRGSAVQFPVIGTTVQGVNFQSYDDRDIVPDLIRMQLSDAIHWPTVSTTLHSLVGQCIALDFGPGRSLSLDLPNPCIRVSGILHQSPTTTTALKSQQEIQLATAWADLLNVNVASIGRKTSFFTLGGDSILAIRAVGSCKAIGLDVAMSQFLRDPTVKGVVRAANSRLSIANIAWPRVVLDEAVIASVQLDNKDDVVVYPVTPMQAGMLLATLSNASAYVLQVTFQLTSASTQARLATAFETVVQQNSLLQTTFATSDGGIVQLFPQRPQDAIVRDVATVSLAEYLASDFRGGFHLEDKSFIRLALISPPDEALCYGVMTVHHAIIDGWSINSFLTDIMDAMDNNQPVDLRPAFQMVVEYIEAQDKVATKCFWSSYVQGVVPTPIGSATPKVIQVNSSEQVPLQVVCAVSVSRLAQVAGQLGVTASDLAKFSWAATLRKFTRKHDVVFGQVRSNRGIPVHGAERILGPLLSTVPCRVTFDDELPLTQLLQRWTASNHAMSAYSHASLGDIAKWTDGQPMFDSLFAFQQWPARRPNVAGVDIIESWKHMTQVAQHYAFELLVELPRADKGLVAMASFQPDKLSSAQARAILHEFDYTLTQLCSLDAPSTSLALWTLSEAQTALIRSASFGPTVPLPFELLHHAFEARAAKHPDVRAVELDGQWLTYGDLNAHADTVASQLAELGVCVGSRVAVVMDRCLEFPIGLLATLKVGAAMMPLDVAFPVDRLALMLSDAGVNVVVSTDSHAGELASLMGCEILSITTERLAANPREFNPLQCHIASSTNEAYIVYTSGSTGRPKGVPVLHKGAVNTMFSQPDGLHHICVGSRVLQVMAIGFDGCQWDTWKALSHGATLVLRGQNMFEVLSTIDVITITPTGLTHLGDPHQYPRLKLIATAGEHLPSSLKDLWADHVCLLNCYGPSECAIATHIVRMTKTSDVTIGKPISNASCHILDAAMRHVPLGVVGEIYLGGVGVSPGYINLPELTTNANISEGSVYE